jgi:ribonuclease-3
LREADPLSALEERLGHVFRDRALLEAALSHPSSEHERGASPSACERLEFLGDAVLQLAVSELLMERHPERPEGWLTRARARTVNRDALAARARALGLAHHVRLGRGERLAGGAEKPSILADILEAVLGALYLDAGFGPVRGVVEREIALGDSFGEPELVDPKTRLQEQLQARGQGTPQYRTTGTRGPAHALEFSVEVRLGEEVLGVGSGPSKRAAEQEAARRALEAGPRG